MNDLDVLKVLNACGLFWSWNNEFSLLDMSHFHQNPDKILYLYYILILKGKDFYTYINQAIRVSVSQFSRSIVSNTLQPHEAHHTRPPCPSPTLRVYSNPCPLSRWCHPTLSSSVIPFSSHLQSFPITGSFQMSQVFASDGQSIGVSASISVLPMNIQDWFPLGWTTGWISLQSKGLSRVFSNTTVQKHQFFSAQLSSQSNSHIHTWHWKNHSLD